MRLPDLFSLYCYLALSETLNFKAAATSLSLSPAALSDRIKRLEEDLGGALFERTTRRVNLTPLGERLLLQTRQLIQEAWRWSEELEMGELKRPYSLKIGTRFELGMSWIVPSIDQLKQERPERSLELTWGTDQDLIAQLMRGEIDVVISSVRLNHPELVTAPLHREDYFLVTSLEEVDINLKPDQVQGLALIDTEAELPLFRYFLDALPSGQGWPFSGVEVMGTIAAVRARVLSGAGVAVLPAYFVQGDLEAGRMRRLRPEIQLHHDFFRLIWRRDQPRERSIRLLCETLRSLPLR